MVCLNGAKMQKRLGNIVSPEDIVNRFGADTARLFILFAAPPERDLEWNDHGVEGCYRFLNRVWRLVWEARHAGAAGASDAVLPEPAGATARGGGGGRGPANGGLAHHGPANRVPVDRVTEDRMPEDRMPVLGDMAALEAETRKMLQRIHAAIKKVTHDVEVRFNFNTAISTVMELVNELYLYKEKPQAKTGQGGAVLVQGLQTVLLLLAPFVPHMAEELWRVMGQRSSILAEAWPRYREDCLEEEEVVIVFQVNGKIRDRLLLPAEVAHAKDRLEECVAELPKVQKLIAGKTVVKTIVVPGKLVNLVLK
jgi:leucyl-tRNA synthetase